MIDTEWFRIKPDPDAPAVEVDCFDSKKYPYFMDAESFAALDHSVVHYERDKFSPCDILFQPTFLIGDRLLELFKLLEPMMAFKGVQMYRKFNPSDAQFPMFWLPYLQPIDAIFNQTQVVQESVDCMSEKSCALCENQSIYKRFSDLQPADEKFNQTQVVQGRADFLSEKSDEIFKNGNIYHRTSNTRSENGSIYYRTLNTRPENGNIYYRTSDARSENGNIYYRTSDAHIENGNIYYRTSDHRSENGNIYYRNFNSQPENANFNQTQVVQGNVDFLSGKSCALCENRNINKRFSDLQPDDEKFNQTKVVQGKATHLSVKLSTLRGRRVAHCRLPADDIWLVSLEAAECLLRRQPIGIVLEKVFTQP